MYCGSAGNWRLTSCTFEVQRFLGRDIGVQRYVMVPRLDSIGNCRWSSYWCIVVVQEIGA